MSEGKNICVACGKSTHLMLVGTDVYAVMCKECYVAAIVWAAKSARNLGGAEIVSTNSGIVEFFKGK